MAQATEQALNTPFFTWLVLVTSKLFATHGAINDLSFSKKVQLKLISIAAHRKMYFLMYRWEDTFSQVL
jgi:hypothetical protein